MYKITVNNCQSNLSTKFHTVTDINYQIVRDIDFMFELDKNNPSQLISLRLVKCDTINKTTTETIIGDFNFEITNDLFDEENNIFPRIYCSINNDKKYNMGICISHYKMPDSDEIKFFVTHPHFTIENLT